MEKVDTKVNLSLTSSSHLQSVEEKSKKIIWLLILYLSPEIAAIQFSLLFDVLYYCILTKLWTVGTRIIFRSNNFSSLDQIILFFVLQIENENPFFNLFMLETWVILFSKLPEKFRLSRPKFKLNILVNNKISLIQAEELWVISLILSKYSIISLHCNAPCQATRLTTSHIESSKIVFCIFLATYFRIFYKYFSPQKIKRTEQGQTCVFTDHLMIICNVWFQLQEAVRTMDGFIKQLGNSVLTSLFCSDISETNCILNLQMGHSLLYQTVSKKIFNLRNFYRWPMAAKIHSIYDYKFQKSWLNIVFLQPHLEILF